MIKGVLLQIIDRDYDKAISDVSRRRILLRDKDGDQKIVTDPGGKESVVRRGSGHHRLGGATTVSSSCSNNVAEDGTRTSLEILSRREKLVS